MLKNQILIPLNVKNKNGRIYTDSELKDIKDSYYGEYNHIAKTSEISINEISHMISNIRIENNNLIGDITILKTSKGDLLNALINLDVKIVFRPRSIGDVVNGYVKNLKIISFDAVELKNDSFYNIRKERKEKLERLNERMLCNNNIL